MTSVFAPALQYFGLTFAAGFALGIVRTLWLAPSVGERAAELLELPLMLLVSLLAAGFVLRSRPGAGLGRRIAIGVTALMLLLFAELGVVVWVRHQTLAENLAARDPVAGAAYGFALLFFAAAPGLLGCFRRDPGGQEI